jgi:hypothetical protein
VGENVAGSPEKFALLLTEAVHKIRRCEAKLTRKTIRIVQDELGYALGREGGSCIEYWRKGNIPASLNDLEALARELVRRDGLSPEELQLFLDSAGHPRPAGFGNALFPPRQELAPFIVGPPITHPRQFFGREQELRRIFGLWNRAPLQNVALIGLHRSGKTSLLRYLQSITQATPDQLRPGQRADWLSQPERYQWVLVDFQDARMGHRESLLRYLLAGLNLPAPDACDLNSFLDTVSRHLQMPSVIMMDEIGAGLASPELDQQFWWSLRALGSNYSDGKLGFLLTAHEAPALLAHEYGKPSPFFNIFGHTLELGPLSEPEARELVASSPQPFAPADVEWIMLQSGRWPALLQILCDTCLTAMDEGQHGPAWWGEGLRRIAPLHYLLEAPC